MQAYDLSRRVDKSGEAAIGPQEIGTLTTYLIYGRMAPGETGRRLRPGSGREEILFVINGEIRLESSGREDIICRGGSAVPLPEGSDYWVSNLTSNSVQYILAGGFTEPAHFLRKVQQQAQTSQYTR